MLNFNKSPKETIRTGDQDFIKKDTAEPTTKSEQKEKVINPLSDAAPVLSDAEIHDMYLASELRKQIDQALSPEERGLKYWQDKTKELENDLLTYQSQLELSEADFNEKYGELASYMKERIPLLIEKTRTDMENADRTAQGLQEKVERD